MLRVPCRLYDSERAAIQTRIALVGPAPLKLSVRSRIGNRGNAQRFSTARTSLGTPSRMASWTRRPPGAVRMDALGPRSEGCRPTRRGRYAAGRRGGKRQDGFGVAAVVASGSERRGRHRRR